MSTRSFPRGIREYPKGKLQAYVTVRGRFHSETFPPDTSISKLKDWRERTRAQWKYGTKHAEGQTFAEDAADYLATLDPTMPSLADRKLHIQEWVYRFGPRVRSSIANLEIRKELVKMKASGLSPASVNRRRTALMAMYTTLDGKSEKNIVKDAAPLDEDYSIQHRGQDMLTMSRIIRQLKPHGKTRLWCHFLQWSGWPAKLAGKIQAPEIDFRRGTVRCAARKKGAGMPFEIVPLHRRAMAALRQLVARDALGPFSTSSMHSRWSHALQKENARRAKQEQPPLPHIRPYDLKHSFGTWAAPRINDDRTLSLMMRTNSVRRYTGGSERQRMERAVQVLQVRPRREPVSTVVEQGEQPAKNSENTQ